MNATSRSWDRRETRLVEACKSALCALEILSYQIPVTIKGADGKFIDVKQQIKDAIANNGNGG